jgi:acyl transferase domain-containing protein/NADP-dependent 3-hydroxy acid dehydrogenase YdfG/acyl carrier protein
MHDIAIVGMACRFPGAPDLASYWELCWNKINAITEVPAERWDANAIFDKDSSSPGMSYSKHGGFLSFPDSFDAAFFGISPREAPHVDPRQRLILETSWEALEDANIPPLELAGSQTSVYVATLTDDYGSFVFSDPSRIEAYSGMGTAHSIIANRLSYFYDFCGPSLTLDTACSGSLVAVHLACQSLKQRESNMALAGGVNIILKPDSTLFFSKAGALSKNGCCKSFDRNADGFVRSEGVGIIVLKRLEDALNDGSRIYALIKGSAVNQDGKTSGIMAPSVQAQENVLRQAYQYANIAPGEVQYIETHGTGTPLGDPIEAEALGAVLAEQRMSTQHCFIGSVKTNIGHTEAAAGMAGMIKTALAIYKRQLPGTLHFQEPNPLIPFEKLPFRVLTESGDWPHPEKPLISGVSSFGFGGTNAHIVLQEFSPLTHKSNNKQNEANAPLFISAQSSQSLRCLAERYAILLEKNKETVPDILQAAFFGRSHLKHRLAVVVSNTQQAINALSAFSKGQKNSAIINNEKSIHKGKLAFVYSGQGTQWLRMGLDLLVYNDFSETLLACDDLAKKHGGFSLLDTLCSNVECSTQVTQIAIFSIQISLTQQLYALNIFPDVVIGQSLGEVAAAFASGALSLEEAFLVVFHRSRLMEQMSDKGKTAQINSSRDKVEKIIEPWSSRVYIAGCTGPHTTIIAGEGEAITAIVEEMEELEIFAQVLKGIDVPFHTPYMNPLCLPLVESLSTICPRSAKIAFYSSTFISYVEGQSLNKEYWVKNLRDPFNLYESIVSLMKENVTVFIEVSPHAVLGKALEECSQKFSHPCAIIPLMRRNTNNVITFLNACGKLFVEGYVPELFEKTTKTNFSLPAYPWQRKKYWIEPSLNKIPITVNKSQSLLGNPTVFAPDLSLYCWERNISSFMPSWLCEHNVLGRAVFPGAGYVEIGLAAAKSVFCSDSITLKNIQFQKSMLLNREEKYDLQTLLKKNHLNQWIYNVYAKKNKPELSPPVMEFMSYAAGEICAQGIKYSQCVNIAEIYTHCPSLLSSQQFYQRMMEHGFDYGINFRLLTDIAVGQNQAIAKINLSEQVSHESGDFILHPSILDALFQLSALTLHHDNNQKITTAAHFLPIGLESFTFIDSLNKNNVYFAYAKISLDTRESQHNRYVDLVLLDSSSKVYAVAEGLVLSQIDSLYNESQKRENLLDCLYQSEWEIAPSAYTVPHKIQSWIIIGKKNDLVRACSKIWKSHGISLIEVDTTEGKEFQETQAGISYSINPACKEHYLQLFQTIQANNGSRLMGVISLLALEPVLKNDNISIKAEEITAKTLALLQGLIAYASSIKLYVITRGAHVIAQSLLPQQFLPQTCVLGIARAALHEEYPALGGLLLDLDPINHDCVNDAKLLYSELLHVNLDEQIAFRHNVRYRSCLSKKSTSVSSGIDNFYFPVDKAYLITGGLGALGKEIALWLSQQGARHIILMNRTSLPERKLWKTILADHPQYASIQFVQSLEKKGCQIELAVVDIGNFIALKKYITQREKEERHDICTVFHAAGMLSDSRLADTTPDHIKTIFSTKVQGTYNLWKVMKKNDSLKNIVFFSSLAALLPSTGQSIYAAGNTFLDAFAHYCCQQGVHAVSIEWGPWKTGNKGMMAASGRENFYAERGVKSLNPSDSASLLGSLMNMKEPVITAANIDWGLFKKYKVHLPYMVHRLCENITENHSPRNQTEPPFYLAFLNASEKEKLNMLESKVREIIALILHMPPEQIDSEQPIIAYGVDSMLALELKNRLELALKIRFTPVEILKGITLKAIVLTGVMQLNNLDALSATHLIHAINQSELLDAISDIEKMSELAIEHELSK